MDYFKIHQQCSTCQRGCRTFQIHLSLFDANGRLINPAIQRTDAYKFTCRFCWKNTELDFYRFAHPDIIRHLKNINEQLNLMKNALNQIYICLSNMNRPFYF